MTAGIYGFYTEAWRKVMQVYGKNFVVLEKDILCECKNIDVPILNGPIIHNHDGYELYLLLDGKVNLYTEGEGKILERGDLVLIKPYDFHHAKILQYDKYDRVVINFKDSILEKISSDITDLSQCFNQTPSGRLHFAHLGEEEIHRFLSSAVALSEALNDTAFGADVLSKALLTQILVMINRCVTVNRNVEFMGIMPKLVSDTFAYIEKHLAEDLSLTTLEKHFQYNGTYISRCFRKTIGITLQQYIIAKRIALAQQYLRQGISPCDVCFMTGFNNYSNFSRTFLQQIGISPKKYQLLHTK